MVLLITVMFNKRKSINNYFFLINFYQLFNLITFFLFNNYLFFFIYGINNWNLNFLLFILMLFLLIYPACQSFFWLSRNSTSNNRAAPLFFNAPAGCVRGRSQQTCRRRHVPEYMPGPGIITYEIEVTTRRICGCVSGACWYYTN
jgi:hypothetical protein